MEDLRARQPGVSLFELVLHGLITDDDVMPCGRIEEQTRIRAEVRYASLMAHSRANIQPQQTEMRPFTARPYHVRPTESRPRTARGDVDRQLSRPLSSYPPRPPPIVPLTCANQSLGDKACCVCTGKEKTHAVAPCFHMCVCSACSLRINSCPLCRGPIDSIHRIYI
jgi:hypothetical protein